MARIVRRLEERVSPLADPRTLVAPLSGEQNGYWRWRTGNYRVIARLEDEGVLILVARIELSDEVYL